MSTAATDEVPESPAKKERMTSEETTAMTTEEEECVYDNEQDLSDDEFYNDGLHLMTAEELELYGNAVMRSDVNPLTLTLALTLKSVNTPNVFAFGLIKPIMNDCPTETMEKIRKYARFAVDHHNEERVKEGAKELHLDITKIINCNVQVACPLDYYITFEAKDLGTGELNQYEAKVVTSVADDDEDDDEVPIFRKKNQTD